MSHTDPVILALRALGETAGTAGDAGHAETCARCCAELAQLTEVVELARHDGPEARLEAPAGGGVPEARAGKLQLFVGGDAALVERHRPLLEVLADPQRITHVGGHGSGYLTKLLVNLLWFGQAIATAEALLLARRSGIDLDVLRRAVTDSAASSAFIRDDLGVLLAGDYMTDFGLDRCCEELTTVTALGREHDVPFELSALVERTHQRALTRYGPADGELLAVALLEEQAGIRLRHGPP